MGLVNLPMFFTECVYNWILFTTDILTNLLIIHILGSDCNGHFHTGIYSLHENAWYINSAHGSRCAKDVHAGGILCAIGM